MGLLMLRLRSIVRRSKQMCDGRECVGVDGRLCALGSGQMALTMYVSLRCAWHSGYEACQMESKQLKFCKVSFDCSHTILKVPMSVFTELLHSFPILAPGALEALQGQRQGNISPRGPTFHPAKEPLPSCQSCHVLDFIGLFERSPRVSFKFFNGYLYTLYRAFKKDWKSHAIRRLRS